MLTEALFVKEENRREKRLSLGGILNSKDCTATKKRIRHITEGHYCPVKKIAG
jgi:hypothetical protein